MFQRKKKKIIIRKCFQTVGNVLDNMAPAQNHFIMATLTKQNNKYDVADNNREAIQITNGSNDKI